MTDGTHRPLPPPPPPVQAPFSGPGGRRELVLVVIGVAVLAAAVGAAVTVLLDGRDGGGERVAPALPVVTTIGTPVAASVAAPGTLAPAPLPGATTTAAPVGTPSPVAAPPATDGTTATIVGAPGLALEDVLADPAVPGFVGPLTMPDGGAVGVLTRTGAAGAGSVELLVRASDGTWRPGTVLPVGTVSAPREVGDLTGDGRTEIAVRVGSPSGGSGVDTLYRTESAGPAGPTLIAIPYDIETATALLGAPVTDLTVQIVEPGIVRTIVSACTPSCAGDPGRPVSWTIGPGGATLTPTGYHGSAACVEPEQITAYLRDRDGVDLPLARVSDIRCSGVWASATISPVYAGYLADGGFMVFLHVGGGEWEVYDLGVAGRCNEIGVDVADQAALACR